MRNRRAVQTAIDELPAEWAEIDVLVNNAGLSRGLDKLYTGKIEDWEEMIDTNVKGLLYVTRAVVPGMVVRGRGHVVNLGSTAGELAYPNGAVYCGTKAAERAINDGLREDVLGTPVRVTSVDPGMVETDFSLVRFHGDDEPRRQGLQGRDAAHRRRHCRCDCVGRHPARACQHCARLADPGRIRPTRCSSTARASVAGRALGRLTAALSRDRRRRSATSIWASAASRAARRAGFDVLCDRMFSRCRFSACLLAFRARALSCAAPGVRHSSRSSSAPGSAEAFAICSSTDLLSHPRAISSFYG